MFTGLVAELGTVRGLKRVQNSYHLTVAARKVLDNLKIGDSVAVNGVCLTVVVLGSGEFTADVMPETVRPGQSGKDAAVDGWPGRTYRQWSCGGDRCDREMPAGRHS